MSIELEHAPHPFGDPKRDAIVEMFRQLRRSETDPNQLCEADWSVFEAQVALDEWDATAREHLAFSESPAADALEHSFAKHTIYADAGFHDPNYLAEEVLLKLVEDMEHAEQQGLYDLRDKIESKVEEVRGYIVKALHSMVSI